MIKKIGFIAISALVFGGCGDSVTTAINNAASGDVTTADITEQNKVLIINDVNLESCVIIKNQLTTSNDFKDAKTLVTEVGVHCTDYGKNADGIVCTEQSLSDWVTENNATEITVEQARGEKACVIGGDSVSN